MLNHQKTHPKEVIKHCLRCGCNNFNTKDQGRSFRCEECNFLYYINSSAAVACLIFNPEGKLLLTRRAIDPGRGMLDLPGGFVEPMERVEDALVREIKEELGVEVKEAKFICSFPNSYAFSGFTVFTLDMTFIVEIDNLDAIVPADDVADITYLFPSEIKEDDLAFKSMYNIIQYYINNNK